MPELTFLHPAALWAMPACLVPLLIHLINRHRARKISFAPIEFLFRVQRRSARRILLKQILLLIIRTLVICGVILAAALPVVRPPLRASSQGATSTVLVVDTSLSMRARHHGQSRFSKAIERAKARVVAMEGGDSSCVIQAGKTPRIVLSPCSSSVSKIQDVLDKLEVGYTHSDLTDALGVAAMLLQEAPGPNRRIVLLTDAAVHAFPRKVALPTQAVGVEVVVENVAADLPLDNHAVLQVEQVAKGPYIELWAQVVEYGEKDLSDLPTEVLIAGQTVARGFVDLEVDKPTRKRFTLSPKSANRSLALVRLGPDQLVEDDLYPLLLQGREKIAALLVNGDMRPILHRDELYYLEHALAPSSAGVAGIEVTSITPDRFRPQALERTQVVFLANVRKLAGPTIQRLISFVKNGGGLFLAMGNQIDVDFSNQILGSLLPWELRDVVALGPQDADGTYREGLAFGQFDVEHPALSVFRSQPEALAHVRVRRAVVLEPGRSAKNTRILIRYRDQTPALVEGRVGQGRVMLFNSSLDRDWTNWPARASFLPFFQNVVAYLGGRLDRARVQEIQIGSKIKLKMFDTADSFKIISPQGETFAFDRTHLIAEQLDFTQTDVPGFYQVEQFQAGQKLSAQSPTGFFVRLPQTESDLTPISPEQLQSLVGQDVRIQVGGPNSRSTHSKSALLLFLVLLLVLLEAVLVRRY